MDAACFTGHRDLTGNVNDLEKRLYDVLERAIIKKNVTDFYSGCALGWDQLASKVVIRLRNKYPQVKLHLVLPCSPEEQTKKWSESQRNEYMQIYHLANSVEKVSEKYYNGCMKARNARLVELADYCFCYFNTENQHSGTAQTVRMALNKQIMVVNFFR